MRLKSWLCKGGNAETAIFFGLLVVLFLSVGYLVWECEGFDSYARMKIERTERPTIMMVPYSTPDGGCP